ncbi:MAG: MEDS domain-containing protein [Terracidiphilus sp.]
MINNFRHLHTPAVYWPEPPAPEHIAHFYDTDEQFLRKLTEFVMEGLSAGESAIVIATAKHESALRLRLAETGIDVDSAIEEDSYIPLDAEEALAKFMVSGWPDGQRFANLVGQVMKRATAGHRQTRAFGEMVALLWERGQSGATVRLEELWNQFSRSYLFPLLCAYPTAAFKKGPLCSLEEICSEHSTCIIDDEPISIWRTRLTAQAAD